ncbi:MAG: CotH kinase family protein, partial [Erysipelotrichaceae bacterium]|nr:CotH kinase family protein [Erysipelotrichaceae bacterium]
MKIKRLMSFILMICMTVGMMPLSVFAEETEPEAVLLTETDESESMIAADASAEEAEIQAVTATAPTQLWVEPTETNGIPARIDVFKKQSGSSWNPTYTYQLYLPGNVNVENIMLSWDGDAQVTVDNTAYTSGNCPIPPVGTTKSYVFKSGNQTLGTYSLITYQGAAGVEPIFIDIDESQGTIAAMDGDHDHNISCVGKIYFNNQWYDMPKIKGRGNYTWWQATDKKAYNISLDKKTTFPGIDSAATKKWSILAEIADHSLLCNRSGFSLAYELGIGQDTVSADVWMNGEYQGCYMVTPKTDSFVTKNGFMIEQDNYLEASVAEGGDPQFKLDGLNEASGSSGYNRITVKKMGDNLLLKDGVVNESVENIEAAADNIRLWLQDAWDAIRSSTGYNSKGKYYTDYIDIESFAKMYLMHEYVKSYDICSGSILFHRDGMTDDDKLIAGPIWDLDNAMGSTQTNSSLGSVGDRRSGQGSFIPNITEYKTSIYKTIYTLHEDFRNEVQLQYNKNRNAFLEIESNTAAMISDIEASALMNHKKVNEISYNNHKYSKNTTLGSGQYQQTFLATTNSQTDWPNYAANLKTYIHARSLWFDNTYYDPNYVPPCEHTNLINPVWSWSDDCSAATVTFECADCGETVSFDGTITDSVFNEDDTITFTAEYILNDVTYTDTKTANAFIATFLKDEGVERVDVYYTQDYTQADVIDADKATARDSSTGRPVIDGGGQLNFLVVLKDGYLFSSLTATPGTYKNIKTDPEGTGNTLLYRLTKVTGSTEITIATEKCEHTNVSNPVWTWSSDYSAAELSLDCADCGQTVTIPGVVTSVLESDGKTITFTAAAELNGNSYTDTKTHDAFTVTFETDAHITVNVFYKNDSAEADETNVSSAVARNGDSGNPVIDGSGQVYYELIAEEGYIVDQVNISDSYTDLEGPEDTGTDHAYRITGITGDLTVTVTEIEEVIELKAVSLTLTGNIGVNFSFDIPEALRADTYISFTLNGNTDRYHAS